MKTPTLQKLQSRIIACRRCPRLVSYLHQIKKTHPEYWCRPVPGWGDPGARIWMIGLAPGKKGANRTGRVFTGDAAGEWVFKALHELGLASEPRSENRSDRLRLNDVYISNVIRCVPPQNKPLAVEIRCCRPYLEVEMGLLKSVRVVMALGRTAHEGFLKGAGLKVANHPFRHGALYRLPDDLRLLDSYHPSRQNTQTGKLTWKMWLKVLQKARALSEAKER